MMKITRSSDKTLREGSLTVIRRNHARTPVPASPPRPASKPVQQTPNRKVIMSNQAAASPPPPAMTVTRTPRTDVQPMPMQGGPVQNIGEPKVVFQQPAGPVSLPVTLPAEPMHFIQTEPEPGDYTPDQEAALNAYVIAFHQAALMVFHQDPNSIAQAIVGLNQLAAALRVCEAVGLTLLDLDMAVATVTPYSDDAQEEQPPEQEEPESVREAAED